ncbi:MAG: tetratricopeptide repeat protein [Planctomycetota bacterium]|jgi:predicted Zn-dependent protease
MNKYAALLMLFLIYASCGDKTQQYTAQSQQTDFDKAILYQAFLNTGVNIARDYYTQKLLLIKEGKIPPNDTPYLFYFRALCYYHLNQYNLAFSDLSMIQSDSDIFPKAQILIGLCYAQTGKKNQAQIIWQKIYNEHSKNPVILSYLGYAYVELNPQDIEGLNYGQTAYALATERKTLEEDKNQVLRNLSYAYSQNGQYDIAIEEYLQKMNRRLPDVIGVTGTQFFDPLIYKLQANIYFSKAIQNYKKGNKLYPIAISYLHLGKYDQAKDYLLQFIGKSKGIERLKAKINLGVCYWKANNQTKAEEEWDSVLQSIKDIQIRSQLGATFALLPIRLEEAYSLCTGALEQIEELEQAEEPSLSLWRELSRNLSLIAFQRAILGKNKQFIPEVVNTLESQIAYEKVTQNGLAHPLLLLDLVNVRYYNRDVYEPPKLLLYLRDKYPEIDLILDVCQVVAENWKKTQFYRELQTEIQWQNIWRIPIFSIGDSQSGNE